MTLAAGPVRFEHHREPLGIGEAGPRLTWSITGDGVQHAYELEMTTSDGAETTGRIDSPESVLVTWPFAPLASRQRAEVRVRLWDDGGPGPWSEPSSVETGLLRDDDWVASWMLATPPAGSDEQPAFLLRRDVVVDRPVVRARLYASAHGVLEVEIDGVPVSDDVLSPGWTSYSHRLRYRTYDVTAQLQPGAHALGVHLADGWFRGHLGFAGERAHYGDRTAALVQLEVEHDDGSRTTLVSDGSWRCRRSAIAAADLYHGETCDLRLADEGWSSPGHDDSAWAPVEVAPLDASVLVAPTGPPVRRTEVVHPVAVTASPSGAVLVDFGVNLVGRVRLHLPDAEAGTVVRLRHAEVLEHGELGTRPLRRARATDTVVLDGRGPRAWEPRFTVHGFRYAEVTGWPGALTADDLEAVVLHTDLESLGTFACSDPDLTRLHENVVRSMRGNVVDLPTDCPQRDERLGWTGDIAVFAPTAAYLYGTAGMLTSWLRDLAADQHDGVVPLFVPHLDIMPPELPRWPVEAGWGDAAVVVPWVQHERFGDVDILRAQWPSMVAWMRAFEERAGSDLDFPDGGMMLGDWLDSAAPDDQPWKARVPWQLVATAYLARSAALMTDIAVLLGRDGDVAQLEELRDRARVRFRAAYCDGSGALLHHAQTAYALAICFDLLADGDQRARAGRELAAQVEADGFHVGTGFLGTPYVCDALVATGHVDVAYRLLLQRECPSWLYPVTMGATTVWERWNSMLPDGSINPGEMTSFNHYALGAVADFLHRVVGGIAPAAPGYRRVRVAPLPGGGLAWATTSHVSPYGEVAADWTLDDGSFVLDLVVPVGVTADVHLPDGTLLEAVGPGEHRFSCRYIEPPEGSA